MTHCNLSIKVTDYASISDVISYFKRSESSLWAASNSLECENLSEDLIDNIYRNRTAHIRQLNDREPETLIEVSERLGLWVLQHYPDSSIEPETEWDRLLISSYFQLTGLLGIMPVREE